MGLRTNKEEWKRQMEWNKKQAKQRRQTLNMKGVTHDSSRRAQLTEQAKHFTEQSKIFRDLLKDGR